MKRTIPKRGRAAKLLPKFFVPFQFLKCHWPTTFIVENVPFDRGPRIWRRFFSQMHLFRVPEDITVVQNGSPDYSDADPDDLHNSLFAEPSSEPACTKQLSNGTDSGGGLAEVDSPGTAK